MTRAKLGLVAVFCLVVTMTGCAGHYTSEPGPYIPPVVDGITWTQNPVADYDCALGIAADGTTFVAGAWNVFAGAAVGWLAYGIDQSYETGQSLQNCWNFAQWNWHSFDLYTHCYGQPTLRSSWTSLGAAAAYVEMPFCFCNVACAGFANLIAPFWLKNMAWCSFHLLDPRCYPGAAAMTDSTAVDDQPLPAGWAPPGWDVNAPIPPHGS